MAVVCDWPCQVGASSSTLVQSRVLLDACMPRVLAVPSLYFRVTGSISQGSVATQS